MKTSRTLTKILSLVLVICMMFSFAACGAIKNLFGGSLKLESFTVDRSSVKTSYYIGEEIDFSGIKAYAKYSDSSLDKVYTAAELTVTYAEDITATVGTKDVKVSFQDPNLDIEQSTTVTITVIEDPSVIKSESFKLDASDVKKCYNLGETADLLTGLRLIEVMTDKSEREVTDLTGVTFEAAADMMTTAGTKAVKVLYNGQPVGIVVVRVLDPDDSRNNVVDAVVSGNYKNLYEVNETLNLTDLTVTVVYEDGTTETLTHANITPDKDVNMATPGNKDVKVTFSDPVNGDEDFAYITVTVVKKEVVHAFLASDTIKKFNSHNSEAGTKAYGENGFNGQFAVGGKKYKIGDDNSFTLLPILYLADENGLPADALPRYYMNVDIYVNRGSGYVLLDKTANSLTNYSYSYNGTVVATVDTYNGVYTFNELEGAPLGAIKIVVTPDSRYYTGDAIVPQTLEAEVIDAYNVTEAWQLAIVDNRWYEPDKWLQFKLDHGLASITDDGTTVWVDTAGIVIHNDIKVTADDVSDYFFYASEKDVRYVKRDAAGNVLEEKIYPAGTKYFKFREHVYTRHNANFEIQGNFFNLDFSEFPVVATNTVIPTTTGISAGASENSIFQIHCDIEVTDKKTVVENLMSIGNAPRDQWVADNGSVESTELLSAGGAYIFRTSEMGNLTCNNTLLNSYFINYLADWGGRIEVYNSKTFDSFQNAVFACRDSYFKSQDSYFVGTGGPVIITQSEKISDYNYKTAHTEIINTVLETALVGDELWFKSLGATTEAGNIAALGTGVQQIVAALTGNQVNATWVKDGKMNIKGLLMRLGGISGLTDGYVTGSLTIDGVGCVREYNPMNLGTASPQNRWESIMLNPAYSAGKQILTVYDKKNVAYTFYFDQASTMLYDMSGTALYASSEAEGIFAALAAADVIFMDYGGLSVALELYH